MATDQFERECWAEGKLLAGFDESGMGCLAGHMTVAGVIFPKNFDFSFLPGLDDSKKLTEEKRFELEPLIKKSALHWFCSEATAAETDACKTATFNIYWLRFKMIEDYLFENAAILPTNIITYMDGNKPLVKNHYENRCMVKGDSKVLTISAASVLAKCRKDAHMNVASELYPEFGFSVNKGYWSKEHEEAIIEFGPTPIHRLLYLRNIEWDRNKKR